jgi:hypothetical protein
LYGIDTPEKRERGFKKAKNALETLVTHSPLKGTSFQKDRYGRLVAILYGPSSGTSINHTLVKKVSPVFIKNIAVSMRVMIGRPLKRWQKKKKKEYGPIKKTSRRFFIKKNPYSLKRKTFSVFMETQKHGLFTVLPVVIITANTASVFFSQSKRFKKKDTACAKCLTVKKVLKIYRYFTQIVKLLFVMIIVNNTLYQ